MIKIYDIDNDEIKYEIFKYPSGETQVNIPNIISDFPVSITFNYDNDEELIHLLMIKDILSHNNCNIDELNIPFLPHARQDRRNNNGECLSIKVISNIINSLESKVVIVKDCHSEVGLSLINNVTNTHQSDIAKSVLSSFKNFYLVSPDGGALKKIYKLASKVNCIDVIECSKKRDTKTGSITDTKVHCDDLKGNTCIIVDDICDGGKTFIEIAKKLKDKNCGTIILYVTHGLFTKGFDVFNRYIDYIYTHKGLVFSSNNSTNDIF